MIAQSQSRSSSLKMKHNEAIERRIKENSPQSRILFNQYFSRESDKTKISRRDINEDEKTTSLVSSVTKRRIGRLVQGQANP